MGKTLQTYLDFNKTSRKIATYDHHIYNYISPTMVAKELDPIFSVKGGLVFNWWYSNNAVRIGNSNNYCGSGLPGEGSNSEDFWGLGNDGQFNDGVSTDVYWFDVGVQNCQIKWNQRIQGSDHGSHGKDGTVYGQYAIYVSDQAKEFPCENFDLQISFDERVMQFFRSYKGDDNLRSYDEVIFLMQTPTKITFSQPWNILTPVRTTGSVKPRLKQTFWTILTVWIKITMGSSPFWKSLSIVPMLIKMVVFRSRSTQ